LSSRASLSSLVCRLCRARISPLHLLPPLLRGCGFLRQRASAREHTHTHTHTARRAHARTHTHLQTHARTHAYAPASARALTLPLPASNGGSRGISRVLYLEIGSDHDVIRRLRRARVWPCAGDGINRYSTVTPAQFGRRASGLGLWGFEFWAGTCRCELNYTVPQPLL
jgi:hypothetical protein